MSTYVHKPLFAPPSAWRRNGIAFEVFSPLIDDVTSTEPWHESAVLLAAAQDLLIDIQHRYINTSPGPEMRNAIAAHVASISAVFLELVPMTLAAIDECSARAAPHPYAQVQLSAEEMLQLAHLTSRWMADATDVAGFWGTRKSVETLPCAEPQEDARRLAVLNAMARRMEALPTQMRMLFAKLRFENSPLEYMRMQLWLLYQETSIMRVRWKPLPLALAYWGGTSHVWASDIRNVKYINGGQTAELPVNYR